MYVIASIVSKRVSRAPIFCILHFTIILHFERPERERERGGALQGWVAGLGVSDEAAYWLSKCLGR